MSRPLNANAAIFIRSNSSNQHSELQNTSLNSENHSKQSTETGASEKSSPNKSRNQSHLEKSDDTAANTDQDLHREHTTPNIHSSLNPSNHNQTVGENTTPRLTTPEIISNQITPDAASSLNQISNRDNISKRRKFSLGRRNCKSVIRY